jgi:hypothetical protein
MSKKKKRSIREFISEEDLKFQLYLLKFSQQLRNLKEKTPDEIQNQFNEEVQKRLNLIEKEKEKTPSSDEVAIDALIYNEAYVKTWEAPLERDKIEAKFYQKKADYIKYLKDRIKEENRQQDIDMLNYAQKLELTEHASKERFGQMLLLMIKNMATMPSFSGYTENWKTDFYSNAIEKTLLYVHNFDEDLRSKRSGDKSKAFAYVTQICFNAFINIINIRKAESSFIKETISYNSANVDGLKYMKNNEDNTSQEANDLKEALYILGEAEDVIQVLNKKVQEIKESNFILKNNKSIRAEIKFLDETTPQEQKTKDYEDYVNDLENQIRVPLYMDEIEHLIIQKPKGYKLPDDISLPEADFAISVRGPVEKKEKPKKPPKEKDLSEIELEKFNEEW